MYFNLYNLAPFSLNFVFRSPKIVEFHSFFAAAFSGDLGHGNSEFQFSFLQFLFPGNLGHGNFDLLDFFVFIRVNFWVGNTYLEIRNLPEKGMGVLP